MAEVKISALPAATAVTSDDLVPIVDGGTTTQKATFQQVLDYVTGSTFNDLTVTSLTASVSGALAQATSITGSTISASNFYGDGSGLTNVTASEITAAGSNQEIQYNKGNDLTASDGFRFQDPESLGFDIYQLEIGGTAPSAPIYIAGLCFINGSGGSKIRALDGSNNETMSIHTTDTQLSISSSTDVIFPGAGSVGIGTSTPAAKLDVSGSLIADVALSGAVGSEITSTSYTLSADDRGKTLLFSSSATQGITCSSGLSVGYNATFIQLGSGQLELTASGVSVLNRQSHTKSAGLYAAVSVVIVSADTYILAGDTSA